MASNYNQADSQAYYIRHKYAGGFAQDSWRIRSNLTLNYGVRWDLMEYWSEKYNQIPTFLPGEQSIVYPGRAARAWFIRAIRAFRIRWCRPRTAFRRGWAWRGRRAERRTARKDFGGPGKTSIRAGYGIYNSVIEGNTMAFDEPQPPYGLSYTSPAPPLFATPFMTRGEWQVSGQPVSADVSRR